MEIQTNLNDPVLQENLNQLQAMSKMNMAHCYKIIKNFLEKIYILAN